MPNILFATNRQRLPDNTAGSADFGDATVAPNPDALTYATATVAAVVTTKPDSGVIQHISPLKQGGFDESDLQPLLRSQNDVLVFVHGAANGFQDAIKRAAYNKEWLGGAVLDNISCVCDVIVFTWPARVYSIANIIGDYIDYRHDQTEASASAPHFAFFLMQMQALRPRIGNRRLHLLCHSMGNYMLGAAVEQLFAGAAAPPIPLFDEVVLAAADETATTFSTPNGGRLANLWRLGREITVYCNNNDVAMDLSHLVNRDYRLGYDGPPNTVDTQFFSPNVYEFVDCTGVNDFVNSNLEEPDRSHQYYRQSPTVRADILVTLAGLIPPRPRYDRQTNVYSLFPPA
jgi:esterase/lipase superfamily enzyme